MFDPITAAAYHGGASAVECAQAVRDCLGTGPLEVTLRVGGSVLYAGTFTGGLTLDEASGALTRDVVLAGAVTNAGTPDAASWACRIANAAGRYIEDSFGPGGRFAYNGVLVPGQGVRLRVSFASAPPPPSGRPAWRAGMVPWQWKAIPNSGIYTHFTPRYTDGSLWANPARISAYNSLAVDRATNRVFSARSGGHGDGAENDVSMFEAGLDVPKWTLLRSTTRAPDVLISSPSVTYPHYADGRPAATHLYYTLHYVPQRERIFTYNSGSLSGGGSETSSKVDAFSLAAGDWDAADTFSETPLAGKPGIAFCQDYDTGDLYTQTGGWFRRWKQTTGTWESVVQMPSYALTDITYLAPSAFDSQRKHVLYSRNSYRMSTQLGILIDAVTGTLSSPQLTGAAAPAVISLTAAGMEYIAPLDRFLIQGQAHDALYTVDPATFYCEAITTTGGESIPDIINGQGVHNKFRWMPNLGGCLYLPDGTSDFWFLATE